MTIDIRNIHKSFRKNYVLKGVDLTINKGGIWAVLGPNASGKTTLIKTILGMVLPDDGQIYIDGENVLGKWEYKNSINYLPQIARFPDNLTVVELFKMIEELRNSIGNLQPLINRFDIKPHLKTKLSNLSGGTKQKVNLALALMYDNPIYILDEPTAGLDPLALIELKDILFKLKDKNRVVIITTHIMSLVEELADNIIFILEGEIHFNGSPKELKKMYDGQNLEHSIAKMLNENDSKL
ncbi:MAG: ATP-binding cassette domain-containing protein [Planctomycetia bacterium]|nr:ATP-binding cassette domain-containing protein [Planctomycetia bacterium]